jgi:hypothetical protein
VRGLGWDFQSSDVLPHENQWKEEHTMSVISRTAHQSVSLLFALILVLWLNPARLAAQTTISTGSIIGTVTDTTRAVVPRAAVSVINKDTGRQLSLTTNSAGIYNSGPLTPGDYTVRVEAPGFHVTEINLVVQVDNIANGDATLEVGSTTTTVVVEATQVEVNTEQATVQGVITTQQIENLPINGRNFLQLAQLEPGVQIQDGAVFDPTKNGFASISFGGRYGRSARIEVDGGDISDENVGTTTMNIPASAIQEFQIEQSSLDLSSGMTSSGAVNISTRSGSNALHGEGFGYGRWHNAAARVAPEDLFFRREQFGANVGGAFIKNKLFFFADWERARQDFAAPVELSAPFAGLSSSVNEPFKEHDAFGRLDWQATEKMKLFYRYTYNINSNVVPFIPNTFQPFLNRDNSQDHLVGMDWTTGNFTHSFRFEFLRFGNALSDAVAGSGIFNPAPGVELAIGGDPTCTAGGLDVFCSGTNFLAPQVTQQHDLEFKYDGSTIRGKHMIRYGTEVNRILGGGYAAFLALAPAAWDDYSAGDQAAAASGPFPGGAGNPLNYPVDAAMLGNGQGFDTSLPQFGFPAGGQFDTRFSWYIADNWKIRPNLNISIGLHYIRDTGRSDSQLGGDPAINAFGPGLGAQVHQPNLNFAPQLGIAWDPWKNGKTVFRAGGGIYYENTVWNNVLFDAPARLKKGLFWNYEFACGNFCGEPLGIAYPQIVAAQQAYDAATLAAGASANPSYIGTTLNDGPGNGLSLFAPNFRTPYSIQLNFGVQHQFRPGTVLSVDYLRNRALHYLAMYDTNHVGAARFLDKNAALNAINATNESFNCPDGVGGIDCAIAAGANITSYAGNGLDSGASVLNYGGPNCHCAFPGANPAVGQNDMLSPIGFSNYNGLDVSLKQQLRNPMPGVKGLNLQVSYSLSRLNSMMRDQDFGGYLVDSDNYNHYIGPTALDRTNQFSFGGVFDLVHGFQLSLITHAYSSLPASLTITPGPTGTYALGQIFQTDMTGDGTTGDILPGTNVGSFGRKVNPSNINKYIDAYNIKYAGEPTPAGQALVSAGLFNATQLQQLGGVAPQLADAPAGEVGIGGLFTADLGLTYIAKVPRHESITVQPSITFYNVTNSQNFDQFPNRLSGILQAAGPSVSPGYANSTTYGERTTRVTLGSGTYGLGGPRVLEFGLKFTF